MIPIWLTYRLFPPLSHSTRSHREARTSPTSCPLIRIYLADSAEAETQGDATVTLLPRLLRRCTSNFPATFQQLSLELNFLSTVYSNSCLARHSACLLRIVRTSPSDSNCATNGLSHMLISIDLWDRGSTLRDVRISACSSALIASVVPSPRDPLQEILRRSYSTQALRSHSK